jgi:bla regulator protein BlaR1
MGKTDSCIQPDGPSLFTLVREQLGLKLVSTKSPIDVPVIDHAEKPSVN